MRGVKLEERDLQMLGVLAEARWLTEEQLRRLFFPGTTARGLRRRISRLCAGENPLVKRVAWRHELVEAAAWGLTPAGYVVAERVLETTLDVPRDDTSPDHMAHHLLMTDLLVGLLEAPVLPRLASVSQTVRANNRYHGIFASALHPAFGWNVAGERVMSWRQPNVNRGGVDPRRLLPDAILEFPRLRRRVFIESEMGTHTIVSASDSKTGATVAKARSYTAFCNLFASHAPNRTFYQERYPDGYASEVLFLVRPTKGDARERNVRAALAAWSRTADTNVNFRVATVTGALRHYTSLLGLAPPRKAPESPPVALPVTGLQLTNEELQAIPMFVAGTLKDFKARRDQERVRGAEVPTLEYPAGFKTMHKLAERLRNSKA